MFIIAHILLGLIIGNFTGMYLLAILVSVLIDVDHLIPYVRHKIICNPKKFWKTITSPDDPYGDQRNYLHSLFVWVGASILVFVIDSSVGFVISLAWLGHLMLDALDGSDYYLFYPLKWNLRGPIAYLSWQEWVFTLVLFGVYFLQTQLMM